MEMEKVIYCKVVRETLDRQGYTQNGRYFGVGGRLFRVEQWCNETGEYEEDYVRSGDYQSVRAQYKAKGWKVLR